MVFHPDRLARACVGNGRRRDCAICSDVQKSAEIGIAAVTELAGFGSQSMVEITGN
jgi:hypothetical protein